MPTSSRETIALPLARPARGDAVAGRGQAAHDGRAGPADARVGGHPDRLVDDDEVVVVVDDAHPGHGLGDHLEGRALLAGRQRHLEQVAGTDPVGLAGLLVVDLHVAGRGEVGGLGARDPEEPGQGSVDALPLEAVGDEKGSGVSQVAICGLVSSVVGASAVDADAAQGQQPDQHGGADDGDVGDVADEQAEVVDEVHDVAPAGAGLADHPVGEVAQRPAEQQAERPGPAAAADPAGRADDDHAARRTRSG